MYLDWTLVLVVFFLKKKKKLDRHSRSLPVDVRSETVVILYFSSSRRRDFCITNGANTLEFENTYIVLM